MSSAMRKPHAGLQHQAGNAAHWNMGARTLFVDHDECIVHNIHPATLDEEQQQALFNRYGSEIG